MEGDGNRLPWGKPKPPTTPSANSDGAEQVPLWRRRGSMRPPIQDAREPAPRRQELTQEPSSSSSPLPSTRQDPPNIREPLRRQPDPRQDIVAGLPPLPFRTQDPSSANAPQRRQDPTRQVQRRTSDTLSRSPESPIAREPPRRRHDSTPDATTMASGGPSRRRGSSTQRAGASRDYSAASWRDNANPLPIANTPTPPPPAIHPPWPKAHPTKLTNKNVAYMTIRLSDINPGIMPHISIKECKFLASYNWIKADVASIYVPGTPARWSPPALPFTIAPDSEQDEHRRLITAPRWAPFFASMLIMQPNYPLGEIDLVTDRSSLRRLFEWVCSSSTEDSWRLDANIVEGTMFLSKWVKSFGRFIGPGHSGYGFGFEKACLKFEGDVNDSSSHHRILEYELGGLKCLVQSEADGYVADNNTQAESGESSNSRTDASTSRTESLFPEVDGVKVIQKGDFVSPLSIVEAKCTSHRTPLQQQKDRVSLQCWLSQTQTVLAGQHQQGTVNNIETFRMGSSFSQWEKHVGHQHELRRLIGLIKVIRKTARDNASGRCYLIYDVDAGPGILQVLRANDDTRVSLSDEVKEQFWPRPTPSS
ncbi:uncharacterized protein LY89DRAFT_665681 [Mollisia scopiformis]|uniref:Decapping nuclease n=1 Tax=Mollisia scopiformis TaxID=149040 RepID=A0A194XM71_MOLSC|nr:uncharacterized protein LY89DRAFT_665681 [Mollisia scopiformis]KUJ21236.1 hypothetical protein LY89DRAFT_665681 [Mollisia scopiformis]